MRCPEKEGDRHRGCRRGGPGHGGRPAPPRHGRDRARAGRLRPDYGQTRSG